VLRSANNRSSVVLPLNVTSGLKQVGRCEQLFKGSHVGRGQISLLIRPRHLFIHSLVQCSVEFIFTIYLVDIGKIAR